MWFSHCEEPWDRGEEGTTDRVDGYLQLSPTKRMSLDVASLGDECCCDPTENNWALDAWMNGRVYASQAESHGVLTLIVPRQELTHELVEEALRRFNP